MYIIILKGGISIIYLSLARQTSNIPYIKVWEKDLQNQWDLEDWHLSFSRSFKEIFNSSLIEANLKVITRLYLVLTRLPAFYPSSFPLCFWSCHMLGTMIHIWWEWLKMIVTKSFTSLIESLDTRSQWTQQLLYLSIPPRISSNIPRNYFYATRSQIIHS